MSEYEYRAYDGDLPGSSRSPCLGCGGRIVMARDPHVRVGGRRDGSVLILIDAEPQLSLTSDVDRIFEPGLELLGAAHRACADRARQRLEAREVDLPDELPTLVVDEEVPEGNLPALHLPPQPEACPFCGATELTEEDVWPRWISRELKKYGGFVWPSPYGSRRDSSINITVPICGQCNNVWLSTLEKDVRPVLGPMIRGEEQTLSPDEQKLFATWAVKTALMLDLVKGPIIPNGFYQQFRQRKSALPSNIVWLGAYLGSKWAAWARHQALHIGISEQEPPNAFVTTFTAFRVVFQVFGHFTRGGARLEEGRLFAPALERIWPPSSRPIDWPPRNLAFSDDWLRTLAKSFSAPPE